MRYKNHIFDVGAFNGLDGLILALKNKNMMVHAFEANPALIKIIKKNKRKIEKFEKIKINNYKINNYAISDKNKFLKFNIAINPTVSSLNSFSKNIDQTWPGYRKAHCTFIKKIRVKGITLEKYCQDNKITRINYLHIDTQGSDLKVLKGLKRSIRLVEQGVLEASISKKKALYQNNHTISEAKYFLNKKNFLIKKIEPAEKNLKNERNIYFYSKKKNFKNKVITKYKVKYFERIVSNNPKLKHKIINTLRHLFNIF